MKDNFLELWEAVKKNRKYCPWAKEQTTDSYAKSILEEGEEVLQAIENENDDNLQEELGDVFWNLLLTMHIAEQEGKVNSKKVIEGVIDKFRRRKPFIFEERTLPIEKVKKMWYEAKAKEKGKD